jgi:hypothetical protein
MPVYLVETVRAIGDRETDTGVSFKVPGQHLVEQLVKVGEVPSLSADFVSVAPMVTGYTRYKYTLVLLGEGVNTPDKGLEHIDKGRHDLPFIGRHELFWISPENMSPPKANTMSGYCGLTVWLVSRSMACSMKVRARLRAISRLYAFTPPICWGLLLRPSASQKRTAWGYQGGLWWDSVALLASRGEWPFCRRQRSVEYAV